MKKSKEINNKKNLKTQAKFKLKALMDVNTK